MVTCWAVRCLRAPACAACSCVLLRALACVRCVVSCLRRPCAPFMNGGMVQTLLLINLLPRLSHHYVPSSCSSISNIGSYRH